jgi:hypothetical protein
MAVTPAKSRGRRLFYFATTNAAKLERTRLIFSWISDDLDVESVPDEIDVEENEPTLEGNSLKKVMAYNGRYGVPVIALDSGVFIEGEALDPVKTKRNALHGEPESKFTKEEVFQKMLDYYIGIAKRRGGTVDFYFKDAYTILYPDGRYKQASPVRHYTLTTVVKGPLTAFPLRSLYISKTTGKRPFDQTEEEDKKELEPVVSAMRELIS